MLGDMEVFTGLIAAMALPALPFAYAIGQLRCLERWRGGWRLAAGLPVAGWLVWVVALVRDLAADPTSHNLFPFEILLGVMGASLYLACLALLRWLRR